MMLTLAILSVIGAVLLAAIFRLAGRVLQDEGQPGLAGWCALLAFAIGTLALIGVATIALAHDPYGSWRQPDNPAVSCCNGQDCRPTRAFLGDDGRWRAWNGTVWLTVPAGCVLPTDLAGDGRSHLCEVEGHIYCFSPTTPKG